ncbi:MAG: hypothetical protein R2856_35930 [Caldilineaceae bacterium]
MSKRFSMTLPLWLVALMLILSACAPVAPAPTSAPPADAESADMPAAATQAQTVRLAIPADEHVDALQLCLWLSGLLPDEARLR